MIKNKINSIIKKRRFLKKNWIIFFILGTSLILFPLGVIDGNIFSKSKLPKEFHLYYGFWGAEFIVENQYILRNDLQEMWDTNYTSDYRWQSVAHLFLDFSYISDGKYTCSVEFKILNITRHGSLIYDLFQNLFYMQDNASNGVYVPLFFKISQVHQDQEIFCSRDATSNIFIQDIHYNGINDSVKGLDYTFYDENIYLSKVDVFSNSILYYDNLNGFLLSGNLPFNCFENFCQLAIPTFNRTNFSANPELKLADTNLKFSISNLDDDLNSLNSPNGNLEIVIFIIAGILVGVPIIVVIKKSYQNRKKNFN